MSKIIKIGIITAVFVFLAAFLILNSVQGTVNVVTAAKPINAGTVVTQDMLTTKSVPVSLAADLVKNPQEIVGKSLNTGRVKGDFIPYSIVMQKGLEIAPGNVLISINVPYEDAKLISAGDKISLVLLSNSVDGTNQTISGLKVYSIEQTTSAVNGTVTTIALLETTAEKASIIAPYVKAGNFKLFKE
ncbi:SAF domain-containing protein [Thermoanaerobacter thermocopriae]|uniref:SAF domain-containing protein n=1 Tax=Thermoanaerobacter thermocopriae TaxID=29350 RepID=UPI00048D01B1|nr:SAF domain-containing protein [Thermoanaerobacter thermocopriae]